VNPGKWAGKAQAYAETFALLCAELVDPLLDALDPAPGDTLLDVGTGTGAVAAAALQRGCAVMAVDPEPDMLSLAAQNAPAAELVRAGLPELDGISGPFTAIAANCVLNQLAEPKASLQRMVGLLAPQGRLAVSTWPAQHGVQQLWNDVVAQSGAVIPPGAERSSNPDGYRRDLDGVRSLLISAGVRIDRLWLHEFVHVVDPELWWSGPSRGVAWIGQVYRAQSEAGATAMERAYRRLSADYRGSDGLLHLPASAIMAVGGRPTE